MALSPTKAGKHVIYLRDVVNKRQFMGGIRMVILLGAQISSAHRIIIQNITE